MSEPNRGSGEEPGPEETPAAPPASGGGLGALPPPTGPAYGSPPRDEQQLWHQSAGDRTGPGAPAPDAGDGLSRTTPSGPATIDAGDWRRLDRRMLAVRPFATLPSLIIPAVAVFFGIGRSDAPSFVLGLSAVGLLLIALLSGLIPWLATRYRITEERLEVRRGLINISTLTARLDRIRSVDLEAPLFHRLFRVQKVKVGTGVDDTRIELDALDAQYAQELKRYLLQRRDRLTTDDAAPAGAHAEPGTPPAAGEVTSAPGEAGSEAPAPDVEDRELARINWSWLRYAPFGLSGLAIVAVGAGVFGQYGADLLQAAGVQPETFEQAAEQAIALGVLTLVLIVTAVVVIGWLLLSTLTYIVQWWNFVLTRTAHGTLAVSRGLFTTRNTSLEEARVRGVQLSTTLPLRVVRGTSGLSALATGVGEGGTSQLLPPCPRPVMREVGSAVLEEDTPLVMELVSHGPRARVRRHVRAQMTTVFLAALSLVPTLIFDWSLSIPLIVGAVFLVLGVPLAEDRYRNLGHALTDRYLVASQGSVVVQRVALERDGIIGWVVDQTFFQRRAGLCTLIATTAAGSESYRVVDVPRELAVPLAERATPGVLAEALAR